jgi:hypothetical protein
MSPTFRPLDLLYLEKNGGADYYPGDVLVFRPPHEERFVVHRAVAVQGGGIWTQGDNNRFRDPYRLANRDIEGRVVRMERGGRTLKVRNGLAGRIRFLFLRALKLSGFLAACAAGPTYRSMGESGIFRCLLPLLPPTRVLAFERPHGIELHLLMGRCVIGRRLPGHPSWQIRRPFRLLFPSAYLETITPNFRA